MTATYASVLAGTTSPGLFDWRGDPDHDLASEARAAGWDVVELDTRAVADVDAFWDEVSAVFELPGWFGRNLDAWWDVLGERAGTSTVLLWRGLARLSDVDPVQCGAVVDVLRDASGQGAGFVVVVLDDLPVSDFDGLL